MKQDTPDRDERDGPSIPGRLARQRFRLPRALKSGLLDALAEGSPDTPRTLLLVAHPDDETIGAGASIQRLGDLFVVFVTDGAPLDLAVAQERGFATREAYAAHRLEEAVSALRVAGVPSERVTTLGVVDGRAHLEIATLARRIARLIERLRPDIVVTHAYDGGHTDHDATACAAHFAVGLLCRDGVEPPALFELPTYNAPGGIRRVQNFLPHDGADREAREARFDGPLLERKRRMFAAYDSQRSVLRDFDPSVERFRAAPRYDFTKPPHDGVLNYERFGDPRLGERFRERVAHALVELGLR